MNIELDDVLLMDVTDEALVLAAGGPYAGPTQIGFNSVICC
jgi:hypothetical protein